MYAMKAMSSTVSDMNSSIMAHRWLEVGAYVDVGIPSRLDDSRFRILGQTSGVGTAMSKRCVVANWTAPCHGQPSHGWKSTR